MSVAQSPPPTTPMPSPAGRPPAAPGDRYRAPHDAPRRELRLRVGLVILMIVSLVLAGFCRQWAADERQSSAQIGEGAGGAPLSRMNSFALALLLGGLRGPLVMLLWTSSESQKIDRNLEDFDTKVEWIRLLQPEFDTVHIFQIWNKAYNISVLKASLANKYLTILDALDYAHKVDRERPDDINIVYAIGGVYFDKLGQSAEKDYYTARVRRESLPHTRKEKLSKDDPAWRPLDLDPMLDAKGNILPALLKPTKVHLVDPIDPKLTYDGSELQFLAQYQPFPDGLSPLALGYNYQERAAMLRLLAHEEHEQLSDSVLDSRPPLTLEFWATSELARGRRLELAGFAEPIPAARLDMEAPKSAVPSDLTDPARRAMLKHARDIYALTSRLDRDSLISYEGHVLRFRHNFTTTESHMSGVEAQGFLAAGDRDYLNALLAAGNDRTKLLQAAQREYRQAANHYELYCFRYFLSDQNARKIFPRGYDRTNIMLLDPSHYDQMFEEFKRLTFMPNTRTEYQDDADEMVRYVSRALARISQIKADQRS